MRMIRQNHQPMFRPRSFAFVELTRVGDELVQPVRVVGPVGLPVIAFYIMERQLDGSWKIDRCVLTRAPGQGV